MAKKTREKLVVLLGPCRTGKSYKTEHISSKKNYVFTKEAKENIPTVADNKKHKAVSARTDSGRILVTLSNFNPPIPGTEVDMIWLSESN